VTGGPTRLTPEAIADIRLRSARGEKQSQIARRHRLPRSYVSMIVRGLRPRGNTKASVSRHFGVDGGQRIIIPANVDPGILIWLGHDLIRLGKAAQASDP
jgi:transcriptional regulator with XRE-family HTH domain